MREIKLSENVDEDIVTYIPKWVRAAVSEADVMNACASSSARLVAVLLLDIADFTEITDRFAQQAEGGAEKLSELLNGCFAVLTEVVEAFGGDIVAFTGDGFLVVWDGGELTRAGNIAAQCALALRDAMNAWARSSNSQIRQRISVDVGTVYYCRLGGHGGIWRYGVVGTPFERVGLAYRKTGVGHIALCEAAWRAIETDCEGEAGDGVFRLNGLKLKFEVAPTSSAFKPSSGRIQGLVPAVVVERLRMDARKWLAEFRNVSVLCINFLGARFGENLVDFLQPCILSVQRVAATLEGTLFAVWMDDKGICAVLVFGLPPLAHEEDPLRAVEAGLTIHDDLRHASIGTSIGISSGRLFCGDYGGRSRREYGLLGPAMNTAARLMEIADGGILCDMATAESVRGRVSFAVLQSQRLKGRTAPIQLYRPVGMLTRQQARYSGELVGRELERRELRAKLLEARAGVGHFVLVQGEPGIGKSRLLADLAEFAQTENIPVARGYASAFDRSTPYFAWRQVLAALIDLGPEEGPLRERLTARLQHDPTLASWLPLLRDILPLPLAETPLTERITGGARAASIETLLVGLLARAANPPSAIIFEDFHWCDEASLALLKGVLRRSPRLLVVASRRSPQPYLASEVRAGVEGALEINLGQLPIEAVSEIIKRRLRATLLSPNLATFVQAQTGGNPFYCEEFVSALRDAGAVSVDRGVCNLSTGHSRSSKMALPASLESAIVTRIDALGPEEQLLLKVSSVIGGPFTAELIREVYPRDRSLDEIRPMLDRLVSRELLRIAETRGISEYEFQHAVSEEVTYSLLPFAQRRPLHAAVATSIEKANAGGLEPVYGLLARHWERAGEKARAIEYLERAAEQALRSYANHDAIRYVERAFELSDKTLSRNGSERFSRWEALLGDAYNELADYSQSLPHYERALVNAGQRIVRNPSGRILRLASHVLEQGWLRLVPPRVLPRRHADRGMNQRVAHIRERLAERHFFRNESVAVLDETLAAVNVAEWGGAVTEMISGYSALAIGLGMSGLLRPARFYRNRALRLADQFELSPEAARAYLLAAVLEYGLGEWRLSEQFARRSLSLYRQLGDRARAQTVLSILGSACILRGDLVQAHELQLEANEDIEVETLQGKAWRLAGKVMISTIRGDVDAYDLEQLREVADAKLASADELLCLGTVAAGYLQRGEISRALAVAQRGLAVLRETKIIWGNYIYGASGVIEAYLACWAAEPSLAAPCEHAGAQSVLACACVRRATRTSPACRPRSLLLGGRAALLLGRPRRARRMWTQAAALADRLQLRREQALALYEIGRTSVSGDPSRNFNLSRAAEIFEEMGADKDLAAVRMALSS